LAAITALGFIPTKAAANALVDLAEKASSTTVKTNAMWWLLNYKDIRWKDAGIDAQLKQRKLFDPDTVSLTPSIVPEPESTKLTVAQVAALKGDAKRGADKAQACMLCHRLGDKGNDYGPALAGFAKAQTAEVVINAIINPSAEISHGFEGFELSLRDGGKIHGLVLSSGDPLIMQSMGGLTQTIPMNKTRGRPMQLGRSLMLSAEQLGLNAQDVADIVAYLRTL
jgi:putative heme-binding domain-containing protein